MIELPDWAYPASATPVYIDKGGIVGGGNGAPDQRVNHLGDRFGLALTWPPSFYQKIGRILIARLVKGQSLGLRIAWPLQDFDPGAPGAIKVNGAAQAGSTLVVDGATPNYVAREGQFFSIETAGAHYLYMVATETIFNNSGQANVPIWPPLRAEHADNDVCHFGKPMIEGFVQGDSRQWELAVGSLVMPLQAEVHERA